MTFIMTQISSMRVVSIGLALALTVAANANFGQKPKVHFLNYSKTHGKIWTVQAQIPQVSHVQSGKQLNRIIYNFEVKSCLEWISESGKIPNTWTHMINTFGRKVRSIYAYPRLVSYVSGVYTDTGGAHPGYFFDGLTCELIDRQWKPISTGQFFKKGYPWQQELNKVLLPIFKNKGATFLWDGSVKRIPKEDMGNVVVTPTGLRFYVNPYDIGPWAQGIFVTNVPYAALKGLDPSGPLKGILPPSTLK